MTSYLWKIDDLIEALQKLKAEGYTYAWQTGALHGQVYAPSTKTNLYRLPIAFDGDIFKAKDMRSLNLSTTQGIRL